MNSSPDDELRARFRDLRADRRDAPPFEDVVTRAETRPRSLRPTHRFGPVWIVAAAVVVVATGVMITRSSDRSGPVLDVPSIATWRSPTASLLRTSGRELLAPPPILSSSLGRLPSVPVKHTGASR
jgi:hypothetical protein